MPALDRAPRERQAAQRPVSVGASTERPTEMASDRETVGTRDFFEDRGGGFGTCRARAVVAVKHGLPHIEWGSGVGPAARERAEGGGGPRGRGQPPRRR